MIFIYFIKVYTLKLILFYIFLKKSINLEGKKDIYRALIFCYIKIENNFFKKGKK